MSGWTMDISGIGDGIALLSETVGDPHQGQVDVSKAPDAHSPALFSAEANGSPIDTITLHGGSVTYTFTGCLLTAFSMRDDVEYWRISYTHAAIDYASADGEPEAHADWDLPLAEEN